MYDLLDTDTLKKDASHHESSFPRTVGSDLRGPWGGYQPSAKLITRMDKLSAWRIDPSTIEFSNDTRECYGGHAIVSKAKGQWMANLAVKKMRMADDTDLERTLGLAIREAEFLAEFDHQRIIHFEGFVEDVSRGIIWLVFPWADNGNLKAFVALLDWEIPERISLINDVTQGLAYLHSREPPICHGDLKSLNVLVDGHNRAAITDFGSARRLSQRDPNRPIEQSESEPRSVQSLQAIFCASTNTVTLTGNQYTLRWAAPELLLDDQLSLWSDIWALGWIAYEVMTNSIPFHDASTDIVVIQRVLGGDRPSLTNNAHLSLLHELCSLMNMCWKNDPTERPTADFCRESIQQMPMFAPELDSSLMSGTVGNRALKIGHLRQLGHMYQSRGEYSRAFDYFSGALEETRLSEGPEHLLARLGDLAQVHRLRNQHNEAAKLYSEALGICEHLHDEKGRASILWGLAEVHRLQQKYDEAVSLYSEALEVRKSIGDKKGAASALRGLAVVRRLQHKYEEAIRLCSEALEICTARGDKKGRASTLWGLAEVHRLRHEYNEAIRLYSEAMEIRTELRDRKGRASALWGLAEVNRLQDEYDEAIRHSSEALEIWTNRGDREGRALALWGLAQVHRLRDEYEEATQLYSEALKIWTDLGDKRGRASALWGFAEVHRLRHQYEEAISLYSEALEIRTDVGDRKGGDSALWGLADVYRLQRKYEEAIGLYSEALEIWTERGDKKCRASALWGLAEVHRLRAEYDEAIRLHSEALKIWTDIGHRRGRACALWGLAEVCRLQTEYDGAISLYNEALGLCTDIGDSNGRAAALLGLAAVHCHQGSWSAAVRLHEQAADITDRVGDALTETSLSRRIPKFLLHSLMHKF